MSMDEKLMQRVKEGWKECCILNDSIADEPEISGEEEKTCKKIVSLLERHGLKVEMPVAGQPWSFRTQIHSCADPVLRVAIVTEYDALPEMGHACGHCVSGSISVLAALALMECTYPICVDLIGTPDEELRGAKTYMVQNGVFDQYDFAIMIHLDNKNRSAVKTLCIMDLKVDFFGKSSHAASAPWEGRNALNGVQLFFHAVDMLRQHVTPDIMMHGIIQEGGTAANIVPEKASAYMYIRGDKLTGTKRALEMVQDCARGAAIATQTEVQMESLYPPYQETVPSRVLSDVVAKNMEDLHLDIGDNNAISMGSTDFGNISSVIPVVCPTLKISEADIHTAQFAMDVKGDLAHEAICNRAYIIAKTILDMAQSKDLIAEMKKEFKMYYGKCV